MAPKRKLKQISNYDGKSIAHLNLTQMKEKPKIKRIKKTDTTEDPKVVFESNRTKVFQLLSQGLEKW